AGKCPNLGGIRTEPCNAAENCPNQGRIRTEIKQDSGKLSESPKDLDKKSANNPKKSPNPPTNEHTSQKEPQTAMEPNKKAI
ncbi:hypothetical protein, partial [Bacillus salacetis]|uniref:hypothetical protein n=1 Tax=Bacillus salacetis TaxID=2315464 RepID=UPI00196A658C